MKPQSQPFLYISCLLALAGALGLAACQKTTSKVLTKMSQKTAITQGNLMFREDMARLRLGMSKEEVQFILGAPLVTGSFEDDRWYYLFYLSLKPFADIADQSKEITFSGESGAAEWETYWTLAEPIEGYGAKVSKKPVAESSGAEDPAGPGSGSSAETENAGSPDDSGAGQQSLDESERITTVRRDRFVESKKGYIAGSKIVFYGRMSLQFGNNRLASIDLLETPELSPRTE